MTYYVSLNASSNVNRVCVPARGAPSRLITSTKTYVIHYKLLVSMSSRDYIIRLDTLLN